MMSGIFIVKIKRAILAKAHFLPLCLILCSSLFSFTIVCAQNNRIIQDPPVRSYIAIIIDDLGYKLKQDQRAINLPGNVTYAFLPHSPHVQSLANSAHNQGNEIMLHLPMQAIETLDLGPGALTSQLTEQQFRQSVLDSIHSIPHIKGINNHMGSLITSKQTNMNWLMDEIAQTDLFFVDSRTTVETLAEKTANRYQIANTRRNVFLDNERNRPAIEFQFNQLLKLARKNGSAIAIGHPFRETLDILEAKIPQLRAEGIQLIPVSRIIKLQSLSKTRDSNLLNYQKSLSQKAINQKADKQTPN